MIVNRIEREQQPISHGNTTSTANPLSAIPVGADGSSEPDGKTKLEKGISDLDRHSTLDRKDLLLSNRHDAVMAAENKRRAEGGLGVGCGPYCGIALT